jgi:bacteriorhodopsin
MADIDVVPKHRSLTWLWVVLAVIVIAVVWWALAGRTPNPTGLLLTSPLASAHAALRPLLLAA